MADPVDERLVVRVIGYAVVLAEIIDSELLFQLPQLGFHFLQIRMRFPLRVCERFLNHHKLIEFMFHIEVGFLHLFVVVRRCGNEMRIRRTSGTYGGWHSLSRRLSQSMEDIQG